MAIARGGFGGKFTDFCASGILVKVVTTSFWVNWQDAILCSRRIWGNIGIRRDDVDLGGAFGAVGSGCFLGSGGLFGGCDVFGVVDEGWPEVWVVRIV